jgi:hypothetical protein
MIATTKRLCSERNSKDVVVYVANGATKELIVVPKMKSKPQILTKI